MDIVERGVGSVIRFALYIFWGLVSVNSADFEALAWERDGSSIFHKRD